MENHTEYAWVITVTNYLHCDYIKAKPIIGDELTRNKICMVMIVLTCVYKKPLYVTILHMPYKLTRGVLQRALLGAACLYIYIARLVLQAVHGTLTVTTGHVNLESLEITRPVVTTYTTVQSRLKIIRRITKWPTCVLLILKA